MRTFLFKDVRLDVSTAAKHGPVTVLFPKGKKRPGVFSKGFASAVENELCNHGFDPNQDAIICSGDLATVVRFVEATSALYGGCKMLVFNAIDNEYQLLGDFYQ